MLTPGRGRPALDDGMGSATVHFDPTLDLEPLEIELTGYESSDHVVDLVDKFRRLVHR